MTLLLVSNNLGLMWVGMEATTLLTAFLIALHVSRESLEAMWKYLLICSVGVAFAFMGTLLAAAAAPRARGALRAASGPGSWPCAPRLDPTLMRAAFVFLLVGYGTKAGPRADAQLAARRAQPGAGAGVGALLRLHAERARSTACCASCPIVDARHRRLRLAARLLARCSACLSLLVGAGFILFQHDAKRLLAYCSVEHLGPRSPSASVSVRSGRVAALFHTSTTRSRRAWPSSPSAAWARRGGSHDIARLSGAFRVSPLWGVGLAGQLPRPGRRGARSPPS